METDESRWIPCLGPVEPDCRLGESTSNCDFSTSIDDEFAKCIRWRSARERPNILVNSDAAADAREYYHHRMYHKWMRAAARPWLTVGPDEPIQ